MSLVLTRSITVGGLAYQEFLPDPRLAGLVEYLWVLRADRPLPCPVQQTSVGKCSVDLILSLDGHFCSRAEQRLFGRPGGGAYLVGPMSKWSPIETAGRCTAVGARFWPGRAQSIFAVAMPEVADRCLGVSSINPALERYLSGTVFDGARDAGTVQTLQETLLHLASTRREKGNELALTALQIIQQEGGDLDVGTLARELRTSTRQLERRFRAAIGLSPKLATRIARVRRALSLLPLAPGQSWSDVVHSCGFYDQAHFIRELRAIAGATPSRLVHNGGAVPSENVAFVQYAAALAG